MQTRKDLYQAHKLMVRRMEMALVQAEPDLPEPPMRRYNVASVVGIILGVLVTAVFTIIGLVNPGGATDLKDPKVVLVEEETGANYVYNKKQDRLIPVANYASARLLIPDGAERRSVSAASLAELDRGPMVGIQGAPSSLPDPEKLVRGPWSVCVRDVPVTGAGRKPHVTLAGGMQISGTPLGGGRTAPTAMLVNDGKVTWMVWDGRRLRVPDSSVRALSDGEPRKVPAAWLGALPAGPDLSPPHVEERGETPDGIPGRKIGQVLTAKPGTGGAARWYVVLADGFAPITQLQATLLLQSPDTKEAYDGEAVQAMAVDEATINATPRSKAALAETDLPPTMPKVISPDTTSPLCATFAGADKGSIRAHLTVGGVLPAVKSRSPVGSEQGLVDEVRLPEGGVALGGVLPGEGKLSSIRTYYVITDQARRFAVASPDALKRLGYEPRNAAPIPTSVIQLVADGPALDPAKANIPVTVG